MDTCANTRCSRAEAEKGRAEAKKIRAGGHKASPPRPCRSRAVWLLLLTLLTGAQQAQAHHAFSAEFDSSAPVTVRGTVSRVEWINPHAWIHVRVDNADGSTTTWMFEAGTPNTLVRAGLDRSSLPIGTRIVVRGYQSLGHVCEPMCRANGRDMAFEDGRKVFMGSSGTGAPRDGADPNDR